MMKKYLYLLFFLSLSNFHLAQDIRYSRYNEKEQYCIEQNKIYFKLEKDFKEVDFSELYLKIISDFDLEKIQKENLVFYFRNLPNERMGPVFEDEWICKYNSENPFYNQTKFWTKKTIKLINKKLHKNVIPYLTRIDSFIYPDTEDNNLEEDIRGYYFRESKNLIELSKKKSKGLLIEKYKLVDYTNKTEIPREDKKEFFYFPKDNENLILRTLQGRNENFDTIYLEFTNHLDKIVIVKFQYNLDEPTSKDEDRYYRTYQYQNKKWVEIPTKDELKF